MIDSRPRIVPEIGTHHEAECDFLKPLGKISRCLDPDFELPGLGPAFHSDCFPADPGSVVDAYLGLRQPSFARFPMFPLRAEPMNFRLSRVNDRARHSLAGRFLVSNQLIRSDHHHFRGIVEMIGFVRIDRQILGQLKFKTQ